MLGKSATPYALLAIIIVQLLIVYRDVPVAASIAADSHAVSCIAVLKAFRFRDALAAPRTYGRQHTVSPQERRQF
jgi:hypothetical protein